MDDLLTTREVQDLLRVDRITIYRMLNDGRLRGFKVGGLWRFSRREIEAWLLEQQAGPGLTRGASVPAGGSAPPDQVLPVRCVDAIQAVCADALDIAVATTGLDGTPLTGVSNSCAFCDLVLSSEAGQQRCSESWRQRPDGQIRTCHAGLLCASLPIAVAGQAVALAVACQFTTEEPNDAEPVWHSRLLALAAGLDLSEADVRAAAAGVRVAPKDHLVRVPRLLRRLVETFSEIGQERLNLTSRLQRIAEMSRI